MLGEGGERNPICHTPFNEIKRAGTARATSSIIKSGQKDTEASIHHGGYVNTYLEKDVRFPRVQSLGCL